MFFSNAHGELFRLDHVLGHKANFNEFKRTKIIQTVFSEHITSKLEMNQALCIIPKVQNSSSLGFKPCSSITYLCVVISIY